MKLNMTESVKKSESVMKQQKMVNALATVVVTAKTVNAPVTVTKTATKLALAPATQKHPQKRCLKK